MLRWLVALLWSSLSWNRLLGTSSTCGNNVCHLCCMKQNANMTGKYSLFLSENRVRTNKRKRSKPRIYRETDLEDISEFCQHSHGLLSSWNKWSTNPVFEIKQLKLQDFWKSISLEIKIKKKFVTKQSVPQEAFNSNVKTLFTKVKPEESNKIPTIPHTMCPYSSLPILPTIMSSMANTTMLKGNNTDTDTPFQNLYQTDTDTDICFEIHIKPLPIPIIGIYLY